MNKILVEKIKNLGNNEINSLVDTIENLENREDVEIVFTGTLSNGKSTLINALLGKDLLPTSAGVTTSSLMFISKGIENKIVYNDKAVELSKENLETANIEANIIKVYLEDFPFEGVVFVDSPGINDILESREGQTFGYVPNADAVVLVVDASKGITKDEKEFFEKYIVPNKKDKVFMVFNKIDTIPDFSEMNLKVLSYDITLEENLFGVSALKGLVGKLKNDNDRLKDSKLEIFENSLKNYILNLDKYKVLANRKNELKNSLELLLENSFQALTRNFEKTLEELQGEYKKLENDLKQAEEKKEELESALNKEIKELEKCKEQSLEELQNKITQSLQNIKSKEDFVNNLNNDVIPYINNEFRENLNQCFKSSKFSTQFQEMNGFFIHILTKIDDYIGDVIDILTKLPYLDKFRDFKDVIENNLRKMIDLLAGGYIETKVKEEISNIVNMLNKEIDNILQQEKNEIIQDYEFKELGKYKVKMESIKSLIEKRENKIKANQEKLEEIKKEYKEINELLQNES